MTENHPPEARPSGARPSEAHPTGDRPSEAGPSGDRPSEDRARPAPRRRHTTGDTRGWQAAPTTRKPLPPPRPEPAESPESPPADDRPM